MSRPAYLWLLPVLAVAACTGRLPGTTAPPPPAHRLGVQEPVAAPSAAWMAPQEPEAPVAPDAAEPLVAEPVPEYRTTLPAPEYGSAPSPEYGAPAPAWQPAPARSASASSNTQRDQQIAILTDAVTALREEIARSYTHSQELVEETKKLRAQVSALRTELEGSKRENQRLRNQVRTLEKRLGEIRLTPPVATEPTPPPAEPPPPRADEAVGAAPEAPAGEPAP